MRFAAASLPARRRALRATARVPLPTAPVPTLPLTPAKRLLLVGGGHAHVEVLRRFARAPAHGLEVTLVTPEAAAAYSGMLPGVVAGHYRENEAAIPLAPLARAARAQLVRDRVAALDLQARNAVLASGRTVAFDVLALDVGSTPDAGTPGAREHALPVKPVPAFLAAWGRLRDAARDGAVRAVAVVGGGAGGVEILLAMHHRLRAAPGVDAPRFALVTDQPHLLPQHAPAVRRRVRRRLAEAGVVVHFGSAAVAVEPGAVVVTGGGRIAADAVVWATSASAAPWIAASGLGTDARGFACVDNHLRSVTHPFVFASGDCATVGATPHAKSGLYAVRHGPPLATNLLRQLCGGPLVAWRPQPRALALVSTGGRDAILSWGPFAAEGAWVWRWKDRIDRRFVARYTTGLDHADAPPPRAGPR